MAKYQVVNGLDGQPTDMVKRVGDGAFIPFDPNNTDYAAYLAWVAAGNTPDLAAGNEPEKINQ
jgi:hypothetical protein